MILPAKLLQHPPSRHSTLFEELDNSMLTAFMNDHSLFRSRSKNWLDHAEVVKSGCTALIFDIDLNSMLGSFANAGDCRLVVCNSSKDNVRQTVDLNAKALSEVERMRRQHPGEDMLIVSGRLFGKVMSTRGKSSFFKRSQIPRRADVLQVLEMAITSFLVADSWGIENTEITLTSCLLSNATTKSP